MFSDHCEENDEGYWFTSWSDFSTYQCTVLCIQRAEHVFFDILIHNSVGARFAEIILRLSNEDSNLC